MQEVAVYSLDIVGHEDIHHVLTTVSLQKAVATSEKIIDLRSKFYEASFVTFGHWWWNIATEEQKLIFEKEHFRNVVFKEDRYWKLMDVIDDYMLAEQEKFFNSEGPIFRAVYESTMANEIVITRHYEFETQAIQSKTFEKLPFLITTHSYYSEAFKRLPELLNKQIEGRHRA